MTFVWLFLGTFLFAMLGVAFIAFLSWWEDKVRYDWCLPQWAELALFFLPFAVLFAAAATFFIAVASAS
jgi:hypothetical protein